MNTLRTILVLGTFLPWFSAPDEGGGGNGEGAGAGGEGGAGGGSGGAGGEGGTGSGSGTGEGGQGGSGGEGGAGSGGEEWKPLSREETERLQKAAGDNAAEARRLKQAQAERDRKAQEEAGNFKTLYEQEKAEREREQAQATLERRQTTIERVANRLKFRHPDEAFALLTQRKAVDGIDSEGKAETELKKLAKERPHLLEGERHQRAGAGRDGGDGGDGGQQGGSNGNGNGGNGAPEPFGPDRVRSYYDKQSNKT